MLDTPQPNTWAQAVPSAFTGTASCLTLSSVLKGTRGGGGAYETMGRWLNLPGLRWTTDWGPFDMGNAGELAQATWEGRTEASSQFAIQA